jgi:hypothetical protein
LFPALDNNEKEKQLTIAQQRYLQTLKTKRRIIKQTFEGYHKKKREKKKKKKIKKK